MNKELLRQVVNQNLKYANELAEQARDVGVQSKGGKALMRESMRLRRIAKDYFDQFYKSDSKPLKFDGNIVDDKCTTLATEIEN